MIIDIKSLMVKRFKREVNKGIQEQQGTPQEQEPTLTSNYGK